MIRRRIRTRLVWLTVIVFEGGLGAYAQSFHSEPWRDDLAVVGRFTDAYVRLVFALEELECFVSSMPDLPWDPRSEAATARIKALREQSERLPKPSAIMRERSSCDAVGLTRLPQDESKGVLRDAREQLDHAHDALGHRRTWSLGSVAKAMAPGHKLLSNLAESDHGPDGRRALLVLADSEFEYLTRSRACQTRSESASPGLRRSATRRATIESQMPARHRLGGIRHMRTSSWVQVGRETVNTSTFLVPGDSRRRYSEHDAATTLPDSTFNTAAFASDPAADSVVERAAPA